MYECQVTKGGLVYETYLSKVQKYWFPNILKAPKCSCNRNILQYLRFTKGIIDLEIVQRKQRTMQRRLPKQVIQDSNGMISYLYGRINDQCRPIPKETPLPDLCLCGFPNRLQYLYDTCNIHLSSNMNVMLVYIIITSPGPHSSLHMHVHMPYP